MISLQMPLWMLYIKSFKLIKAWARIATFHYILEVQARPHLASRVTTARWFRGSLAGCRRAWRRHSCTCRASHRWPKLESWSGNNLDKPIRVSSIRWTSGGRRWFCKPEISISLVIGVWPKAKDHRARFSCCSCLTFGCLILLEKHTDQFNYNYKIRQI